MLINENLLIMGMRDFFKKHSEDTLFVLDRIDKFYLSYKRKLFLIICILFSIAYSFFFFRLGVTEENTFLRTVSIICSIAAIWIILAFIGSFFIELENDKENKNDSLYGSFSYNGKTYSYSNLKIKQGPGLSVYFFISLRFVLLMKFVNEESLEEKYDGSREQFFTFIEDQYSFLQKFHIPSFRNSFNLVFQERNLRILLKSKKEYLPYLLNDTEIKKHSKIIVYLENLSK